MSTWRKPTQACGQCADTHIKAHKLGLNLVPCYFKGTNAKDPRLVITIMVLFISVTQTRN